MFLRSPHEMQAIKFLLNRRFITIKGLNVYLWVSMLSSQRLHIVFFTTKLLHVFYSEIPCSKLTHKSAGTQFELLRGGNPLSNSQLFFNLHHMIKSGRSVIMFDVLRVKSVSLEPINIERKRGAVLQKL